MLRVPVREELFTYFYYYTYHICCYLVKLCTLVQRTRMCDLVMYHNKVKYHIHFSDITLRVSQEDYS